MNLSNKFGKYNVINADCLSVLERLEDRSIDLVYLDPPWNTGNDFVYIPNAIDDYESFILKVLQQSKRVLKVDGNLILHSVPSLNVDFHNLMTLVFGKENFRAEFILPIKKRNFRNKMFQHSHETIINYVMSDKSKFFPLVERSREEIDKQFPLEEKNKRFRLQTLTIHGDSEKLNYDWKGFTLPKNVSWRYSKNRMDQLDQEGKIFFEKGMVYPKLKVYSDDFSLQTVDTVWNDIASYELKSEFVGQQSAKLLDRIIQLFSVKGDLVLDPFSGSGTSGYSAFQNKRKWIGIEKNDEFSKSIQKRLKEANPFILGEDDVNSTPIIDDDYYDLSGNEEEIYLTKIKKGENERLEFKEMYIFNQNTEQLETDMPLKIIKEVVGFLNSKFGGEILVGVTDKGKILGIEKDIEHADRSKQNIDGLELAVTNKIKDKIGGSVIDLVSISFPKIKKKHILSIQVAPSNHPVFLGDEFIVRNGTSSIPLKVKQFHDLMIERKRLK